MLAAPLGGLAPPPMGNPGSAPDKDIFKLIECNVLFLSAFGVELGVRNKRNGVFRI